MSESTDKPGTTHFGFRDAPVADKQKLVGEVFSPVAGKLRPDERCDEPGIHRVEALLRRHRAGAGRPRARPAGGTGDIAALLKEIGWARPANWCSATSTAMLRVGRDRMTDRGNVRGFEYVQCNASRCVPGCELRPRHHRVRPAQRHRQGRRLREMLRVLPGGQARVLEFSEVTADWFKADLRLPFVQGIAGAGQAVCQRQRQLPVPRRVDLEASAAGGAEGDDEAAGFVRWGYKNPSAGIVAIHTGYKA